MKTQGVAFWAMPTCSRVEGCRRFGGPRRWR